MVSADIFIVMHFIYQLKYNKKLFTKDQVVEFRKLYEEGMTIRAIMRKAGVKSWKETRNMLEKRTYKNVK